MQHLLLPPFPPSPTYPFHHEYSWPASGKIPARQAAALAVNMILRWTQLNATEWAWKRLCVSECVSEGVSV